MIDGGLRKLFHAKIPGHWQAIETGLTGRGVPDSNCCFNNGREIWVEYKKTAGQKVKVRPEQCGWILRRLRMGGNCFIAVRKEDRLILLHGREARSLTAGSGLATVPFLGQWDGGPGKWDWEAIEILLRAGC